MTQIDTLLDGERAALVAVLSELDEAGWSTPSLCAGWRVRDVVAHLLMPYRLSVPRFLAAMARSGFRFDAVADRWATGNTDSNAELLQGLQDTAHGRFNVPNAPPEAPLSHLVIHAEDVYRPLGVRHALDPQAASTVLDQLLGPRGRRSLAVHLVDGLTVTATDTGWTHGTGPDVRASAAALITTLAGRPAAVDELNGSGASLVRRRMRRTLSA
jgi:uncharacterized protein (TIGR03083 family)